MSQPAPAVAPERARPASARRGSRRRDPVPILKVLVFIAASLPALLIAWAVADGFRVPGIPQYPFAGLGANPIEAVEQKTGRWTLIFLFITLAVTPLRRLTGWNLAVRFRRMLGLFAFFYATLHVAAFIVLDFFFDWDAIISEVLERPWITIGMVSWLLLLPLAITSTRGWIRRIGGRRWQLLHRLIYVAAIGGTIHFFLAVKQDLRDPFMFAFILALLLGARLWWRLAGRLEAR